MSAHAKEPGADGWEAIADGWTERLRTGTDNARRFVLDAPHLDIMGDVTGLRVLDAGCGEGRFARMLAERGAIVTGIDLSERMIGHARDAAVPGPGSATFEVMSMTDLGALPDAEFGSAVAYLSVIDVEDYERALAEIGRVVRPSRQFVFSIVHPCFGMPGAEWEPRVPGSFPIMDRDKLYKKIDNYFPARSTSFQMWPTAPAETINYHRPLSDYSRALDAAGFLIRGIHEPVPPDEVLAERDYLREYLRAPLFMILDCVKAA